MRIQTKLIHGHKTTKNYNQNHNSIYKFLIILREKVQHQVLGLPVWIFDKT